MTALSEALAAAQSRAVAALGKQYVGGQLDGDALRIALDGIGLTDPADTERLLHLHHAIPRSLCPPAARRDLRNGITLCNHCHLSWHRGGRVIPRSLFTADEWAYVSSLTMTGRETGAWLDKHYPERAYGIEYRR